MRNRFANFNTKLFALFINHTIKYTPQNWVIWNLIKIVWYTFIWMKKETVLQFNKNICHFFTNTTFFTFFRTKKHLYLKSHITNIDLTVDDLSNKNIHYQPYDNKHQTLENVFHAHKNIYHTQIGYQPIHNDDNKLRNDFSYCIN